jgi:hypothetical protein
LGDRASRFFKAWSIRPMYSYREAYASRSP